MKGTGQERMTLERLVEAKINSFAHPREFFLRKIGSSVGGLVGVVTEEAERLRKR